MAPRHSHFSPQRERLPAPETAWANAETEDEAMRIDIVTLFPEMFEGPLNVGLFQRAVSRGLVSVRLHNLRDHTHDRHRTVDDYPYGGGAGMVLKPEPIFEAVEAIRSGLPEDAAAPDAAAPDAGASGADAQDAGAHSAVTPPVILLTPQGRPFSQQIARELSEHDHLILICGRYEGVDERVREHLVTDEISIGDYVLGGGELPAMVITDAVVRLLPGVLRSAESTLDDSHSNGLLEYPQYTRPPQYRGWQVPDVLLSGDHARIAGWRREQSLLRTRKRRPDLLDSSRPGQENQRSIEKLKQAY